MKTETENSNHETPAGESSWLERNVNLVIVGLIVACIGTLIAQWAYHPLFDDHHPPHFDEENIFGFQAIFGFVAFVTVVFLGRGLRLIIKREEDYYDS